MAPQARQQPALISASSPSAKAQPGSTSSPPWSGALESAYLRAQLLHSRTLIRVASVLALLLTLSRAAELLVSGAAHGLLLVDLGVVAAGSIALAALAWSPAFERLYPPWAQFIVPLRNTIAAAQLAEAAAHGQLELLMLVPLMLIGPFFFLGLRFHIALLTGALTTVAFIASAAVFGLTLPVALRADLFLLIGLAGCAIAARQFDRSARSAFFEGHLIAELAQRDALTGMKNRRVFDEHLQRIWQQAAHDRRTIAILLIDVDHFKPYNDRYGHLAGDDTLRLVARALQTFVHRPLDLLSRYGGEEFAAVLYDLESEQAREIAERMSRAVVALGIEHGGSRTSKTVTVSAGLAVVQPIVERSCRGALQLADQALYEAKLRGRNRVELLDETEYRLLVTGVFPAAGASRPDLSEVPRRRRHRDGAQSAL